ncbi:MAG: hypothetical protein ACTSSJ_02115 [Candidatus Odinarchaeia archaeon]
MNIGEIKAGIVINAILKVTPEIYVYRKKEGDFVLYEIKRDEEPVCSFKVEGDRIIFVTKPQLGDKTNEIRESISKAIEFLSARFKPVEEKVEPVEEIKIAEEPEEVAEPVPSAPISRGTVIPSAPGLTDSVSLESGGEVEFEGEKITLITSTVPIPSTSYVAGIGKSNGKFYIAVLRGKKVIGIEPISSLESNYIIGAIQKIIIIPLFSPYAISKAVTRLINQVKGVKEAAT